MNPITNHVNVANYGSDTVSMIADAAPVGQLVASLIGKIGTTLLETRVGPADFATVGQTDEPAPGVRWASQSKRVFSR